jgi:transcriptional regulator with XRE-family HTH domain
VAQPRSAQLGAAIRSLRKARKLSIEALAAQAGIHWTSLSRIERGEQNPSWDAVAELATVLEIDTAELARLAAKQNAGKP